MPEAETFDAKVLEILTAIYKLLVSINEQLKKEKEDE